MIATCAGLIWIKRIAMVLLLLATSMRSSFGAEAASKPESFSKLQTAIESVLKETKTPGAAVVIVSRDKVDWVAGIGKADVAANKAVTTETLFRIGSVSKAFAALAALKLQEEGKLKLTDTVKQWAPDVTFSNPWEATDPVRLVHLMEHTTGFDDIHLREYAHNDPAPVTLKDALAYGEASRVSRWRPGSRMSYCNSGPAVLAAVVEKVSGQRFEDYVQEHFFRPLHMDTASYFLTPEAQRRLTGLYHADGVTRYPYWHICFRPSGSINASAKDMANYVRFYLQRGSLDGTQLLEASSVERMERTETLPFAKLGNLAGYGLYNVALLEGPFVFHGHNGAIMGGLTEMAYLPEAGRGYVVMINSGNGHALYKIVKLIRHYVTQGLTPPTLPAAVSVPPDLQQHYAGYYQGISPREQWLYGFSRLLNIQKLTFTDEGLSTSVHGFRHERWVAMSERLFRKENQSVATLALLPDAEGDILIQRADGETLKKIPRMQVWSQIVAGAFISVIVLSSLLFAPIWGWRKCSGNLQNAGSLSVCLFPLSSAILLVTFDLLLAVGLRGMITANYIDDVAVLGSPNWLTISILCSSIAFPLSAAWTFYVLYRERNAQMNRLVYGHSILVTTAVAAVAVYYGYWGLIGLRLWA